MLGEWRGLLPNPLSQEEDMDLLSHFLKDPPLPMGNRGIHHVISRLFKDMVCRWKTMQGHVVERKAGWDTHGLPVEIEVQKQLNLMSNEEIEAYGMKEFNEKCKESVWTYEETWREMTERMGFWVDLDDPYVTLHDQYIESAWWSLKQMFDKGLYLEAIRFYHIALKPELATLAMRFH